jgi:hypothetical protein
MSGRGSYGPGVLTQDQLEQCIRLERDINTRADSVDAEEAALNARQAEIERLGMEIDLRAGRVDRYSQVSVDNYNRLVMQHRSKVGDFNARLPAFNARVEAHNAQVGEFNAICAQRRYYQSDMQAVRSKLGIY